MRAAEKLIADQGLENVSIRQIVSEAQQKNESALQYHFGNLSGLIKAIHAERSAQIIAKRAELLDALLEKTGEPVLRDACMLLVQPAFELARTDVDFRRYVKAFGHLIMLTETSPLAEVRRKGGSGQSGVQTGKLLQRVLPQLNSEEFLERMDSAVRLCSSSVYHQARQRNAFRGPSAELFLHRLVDALVGLLGAAVSEETKAAHKQVTRER